MKRSEPFEDRRIWLTGASSGIGAALAKALMAKGAKVALSGRNQNALEEVARQAPSAQTLVLPFDVNSKAAHLEAAKSIDVAWQGLDIAIFNAGINQQVRLDLGAFQSDIFTQQMVTNYFGVVYGIEAALPLLKKGENPLIAATSSIAAYVGLPIGEGYCATKAAVRTLLQGLRIDLKALGIAVSVICPGFIRTPMTSKHRFPMPFIMEPEQAAKRILKGIANEAQEIHFPKLMSLTLKLIAMLPTPLYTALAEKLKPKTL